MQKKINSMTISNCKKWPGIKYPEKSRIKQAGRVREALNENPSHHVDFHNDVPCLLFKCFLLRDTIYITKAQQSNEK
jgi:hypothetical protein